MFLSDEGPTLETLDFAFRIGSTPTFLYFELFFTVHQTKPILHWKFETECKEMQRDDDQLLTAESRRCSLAY